MIMQFFSGSTLVDVETLTDAFADFSATVLEDMPADTRQAFLQTWEVFLITPVKGLLELNRKAPRAAVYLDLRIPSDGIVPFRVIVKGTAGFAKKSLVRPCKGILGIVRRHVRQGALTHKEG